MKFIPVIVFLVVLIGSPGSIQVHSQVLDDPYARPVPQGYSFGYSGSSFLPQWVTDVFPSAERILSMNVNLLVGTPYELVMFILDKVCGIASTVGVLKQDYVPKNENLQLKLYADEHIVSAPLNTPSILLESEYFDAKKNVTIFVTGFESGAGSDYAAGTPYVMKEAYKKRGGSNFIVFDVGRSIENLYQWINVDIVFLGAQLGSAVKHLNSKVSARNIHIIGHSVGAHIAGAAGNNFHSSTGEQIGRITGLDPASPCIRSGSYLQRGDAAFVDIIHSSSEGLGISEPVGDVDFYPNGRVTLQPGCLNVVCSHSRAVSYYIESVYPGSEDAFPAIRCESVYEFNEKRCGGKTTPMGYATPSSVRGLYYLETNWQSPYGKNSE